jgi:hypothetical protein
MKSSYESLALKGQSDSYPASWRGKVPKKILMAKTVTSESDIPGISVLLGLPIVMAIKDHEYEVWVNSHGAMVAITPSGEIGLKAYEFEIIEWHEERKENG